jgi:hypothetical protein
MSVPPHRPHLCLDLGYAIENLLGDVDVALLIAAPPQRGRAWRQRLPAGDGPDPRQAISADG